MSIAAGVTLMGRKQAEALMESACVISRDTGATTIDPDTGVETPSLTMVYTGKCRLRMPSQTDRRIEAAGQALSRQAPELSIPIGALGSADVRTSDIATITTPLDSLIVIARISGLHSQTHSTARRFPVELVS